MGLEYSVLDILNLRSLLYTFSWTPGELGELDTSVSSSLK